MAENLDRITSPAVSGRVKYLRPAARIVHDPAESNYRSGQRSPDGGRTRINDNKLQQNYARKELNFDCSKVSMCLCACAL